MNNSECIFDFEKLIEHINLAISNINNNSKQITDELVHWKSKINIDELKKSYQFLLLKTTKWYKDYKKTEDILKIDLNDYDLVSKEASFILGECALIDDLHAEVINHLILCIGVELCTELKKQRD